MEYQIKLYKDGKFSHNVYITCTSIEQVNWSCVIVDKVVKIDFIISIFSIKENK